MYCVRDDGGGEASRTELAKNLVRDGEGGVRYIADAHVHSLGVVKAPSDSKSSERFARRTLAAWGRFVYKWRAASGQPRD